MKILATVQLIKQQVTMGILVIILFKPIQTTSNQVKPRHHNHRFI